MGTSRTTTTTAIAVAAMASVILLASSPSGVTAADPAGMGVASPSPYAAVDARNEGLAFENLPGFTRGAYERDHALITPESRVYTGLFGWKNTNAAWLITPAMAGGPQFSMYQALMKPGSSSGLPVAGAWRFVFVMDGAVMVTEEKQGPDGAATTYTAHELSHGGGGVGGPN